MPADVAKARKALSELVAKHTGDLEWSRDTRRAVKRYEGVLNAWDDSLVDLARTKGLLPNTKEHRP
ncbi:hypothetical protein [Cellulosimicrobium sp. I38E]|uniref:hypothetical protein n=1 Tax=Cellulosimicrobium sp. I38E TaxID=1393139 RepID=UPI0007B2A7F9|nr:hypothetical protein [Cellulosimicrobium sp. I38E]KZM78081.1 hypothetical protein A0J59_02695 [Cellulosimicrobium sp. I38E]